MLKNMSKILTGDLLKILCDMGHGNTIAIVDANYPAESMGKRVVRFSGVDSTTLLSAMLPFFPIDRYCEHAAMTMGLTESDKAKGMPDPAVWAEYDRVLKADEEYKGLYTLDRNEFYKASKEAYAIIQTGEERLYGNLLLVKGVVE